MFKLFFSSICLLLATSGCIKHVQQTTKQPASLDDALKLIDRRDEWTAFPDINIPRHPAEKFLAGVTIVIDPGHGGDAARPHWKRGPTGVREAEMNLNVSLLLARLLKDANAHVILTRESDTDLDLSERAAIANSAQRPDGGTGADLFISIHHNAGGGPSTNYTSVWYHGQADDNEPDLDVARYVAHALGRHIRTQVAKTSPVLSSHLMYQSGFGVLRACEVPAILCECSFYTDPIEEQRLRDAKYNLREAYAIYEGLCEYAYCGRPTQSVPTIEKTVIDLTYTYQVDPNLKQSPAAETTSEVFPAPATQPSVRAPSMSRAQYGDYTAFTVTTTLSDGLPNWWGSNFSRTLESTISVTLNGQRLPFTYNNSTKRLSTTLPADLEAKDHILAIHHANMFKNHNWPQRYLIQVNKGERETQAWLIEALPATRPSAPSTQPTTRRSPTRASTRRRN